MSKKIAQVEATEVHTPVAITEAPWGSEELQATLQELKPTHIQQPKKKEEVPLYTPTESSTELLSKYGDKSKAIRGLAAEGYTTGAIAKLLNIRYQHVRNVLQTNLKKG